MWDGLTCSVAVGENETEQEQTLFKDLRRDSRCVTVTTSTLLKNNKVCPKNKKNSLHGDQERRRIENLPKADERATCYKKWTALHMVITSN